jgi:hypothetical protein
VCSDSVVKEVIGEVDVTALARARRNSSSGGNSDPTSSSSSSNCASKKLSAKAQFNASDTPQARRAAAAARSVLTVFTKHIQRLILPLVFCT